MKAQACPGIILVLTAVLAVTVARAAESASRTPALSLTPVHREVTTHGLTRAVSVTAQGARPSQGKRGTALKETS